MSFLMVEHSSRPSLSGIMMSLTTKSVSYTHLSVCCHTVSVHDDAYPSLVSFGIDVIKSHDAVSYPHLDVYKRQADKRGCGKEVSSLLV